MTLTLTIRNTDVIQPGMRRELVLPRRGGMIGRANVNDWWLPDPRRVVSSDHCRIDYADGFYYLHDISLNGTFLNGERTRMSGPRRIEPGDEFRIGEYLVIASLSGESEAAYEREQALRQVGNDKGELWGTHERPAPRPAMPDQWDSENNPWPDDADEQDEPNVDDDEWDPVPAAPRPAPQQPRRRTVWEEEEEERRHASTNSSASPDLVPDPSADDIWGRLESNQRIDLDRARIGLDIEENRDPFADFYDQADPGDVLFDDGYGGRSGQSRSSRRDAAPTYGGSGFSPPQGGGVRHRSPVDDDVWDDPDEGYQDHNMAPPKRSPPRPPSPASRREAPRSWPQDRRHAVPQDVDPRRAGGADMHERPRSRNPHGTAELDHLTRAFLVAAGVDAEAIRDPSPAMIDKCGQMLGKLVAGLYVLLEARSRAKAELGAQKTAFPVNGNNPLKFAISPEDALAALINPPARGFMNAGQAIDEAFFDLQAHQEATVMAMRGALRASLDKFSPKAIRKTVGERGFLTKVVPGAEEAELWRAYERAFSGVVKDSDEAFLEVFAREFKAAYEKAGRR